MKLALLFFGLDRRLSVDRLAHQFSNSITILYTVQSEDQNAGQTGGRLRSAQHGLRSESKAAVG